MSAVDERIVVFFAFRICIKQYLVAEGQQLIPVVCVQLFVRERFYLIVGLKRKLRFTLRQNIPAIIVAPKPRLTELAVILSYESAYLVIGITYGEHAVLSHFRNIAHFVVLVLDVIRDRESVILGLAEIDAARHIRAVVADFTVIDIFGVDRVVISVF